MMSTYEVPITLGFLAAGAALAGAMAWLERRPRKSLDPQLVPTTPLLLVGVLIGLLAAVHLLNILGIQTGRR